MGQGAGVLGSARIWVVRAVLAGVGWGLQVFPRELG